MLKKNVKLIWFRYYESECLLLDSLTNIEKYSIMRFYKIKTLIKI